MILKFLDVPLPASTSTDRSVISAGQTREEHRRSKQTDTGVGGGGLRTKYSHIVDLSARMLGTGEPHYGIRYQRGGVLLILLRQRLLHHQ